MGADVAEGARARAVAVEAPAVRRGRVGEPVLEIGGAEAVDLAELLGGDQLAREPDRGHEAVVEAAHVDDAGGRGGGPDRMALGGGAAERLLAEHVLAGRERGERRLDVQVVGADVVEQVDLGIRDQVAPVGRRALEAVAVGRRGGALGVVAGQGDEASAASSWRQGRRTPRRPRGRWRGRWSRRQRRDRRRRCDVGQGPQRVDVRLAHEAVAEHADAERGGGWIGAVDSLRAHATGVVPPGSIGNPLRSRRAPRSRQEKAPRPIGGRAGGRLTKCEHYYRTATYGFVTLRLLRN